MILLVEVDKLAVDGRTRHKLQDVQEKEMLAASIVSSDAFTVCNALQKASKSCQMVIQWTLKGIYLKFGHFGCAHHLLNGEGAK